MRRGKQGLSKTKACGSMPCSTRYLPDPETNPKTITAAKMRKNNVNSFTKDKSVPQISSSSSDQRGCSYSGLDSANSGTAAGGGGGGRRSSRTTEA